MRCFRCQAENADGSRFCGHCGASFGTTPPIAAEARVTAPTRQVASAPVLAPPPPAPSPPPAPFGGGGDSLDASIRVPVSTGARWATIAIVLVIDAAMAGAGIVLLTRDRGGGGGEAPAGGGAVDAGAVVIEVVVDAAAGPGGSAGGGTSGSSGGRGSSGGGSSGSGGDGGGGGGGGSGGGTAPSDPLDLVRRPDAGPAAPPVDAAPAPPTVDATPAAPTVDATPALLPDAGATSSTPDAAATVDPYEPDAAPVDPDDRPPASDQVISEVGAQLSRSQGRMERCYSQATKGLPDDQPLEGEVDIAFEVVPTGETRGVQVARNTTGSGQLATCLADLVLDWTFTPFEGASIDLLRTFRFRPR